MMPGAKGHTAVHACMIRLMTLEPAKHEEVAIHDNRIHALRVFCCREFADFNLLVFSTGDGENYEKS